MSFLRRLIGSRPSTSEQPPAVAAAALAPWDPSPGGYFEIAGVVHRKDVLAELFPPTEGEPDRDVTAAATLAPEPDNPYDPNAVAVQIEGRTVGYIPRRHAPAWADLIARLAAEGLTPRLTARLWIGSHAWFVRLVAREDAGYETPGEAATRREHEAAAAAEKVAKAAVLAAARAEAADRKLAAAQAPPGVCRDCGGPIERTGQRGRPPVRCASCRGATMEARPAAAPVEATNGHATAEPATVPAVPANAGPWVALRKPAGWAILDLETTGVFPRVDRIVEIAVVRLGPDGEELDAWATMLNPQRDLGETEIHGIHGSDVRGAPTFADIAPELLARLSGARVAAHNVRFDLDFLAASMHRAGMQWARPDALCTMVVPNRLGVFESRRLDACCAQIGFPYERGHTALSDARASAAVLAYVLTQRNGRLPLPDPAPDWPEPSWAIRPRLRTEPPPPRFDTTLGQLADRVGVPGGTGASEDAALAYLGILDVVLEDRRISDAEVTALAETAAGWGIDGAAARRLHTAYLSGMWSLARADGVVTPSERHDLRLLSELLGVPLGESADQPPPPVVAVPRAKSFVGKSVCFTGASVCTIGGAKLSREDQEALAEGAGLIVFGGVTKGLDLLVMADPDSQSGKAQKADRYGTRRIAEPAFWRAIGVEID